MSSIWFANILPSLGLSFHFLFSVLKSFYAFSSYIQVCDPFWVSFYIWYEGEVHLTITQIKIQNISTTLESSFRPPSQSIFTPKLYPDFYYYRLDLNILKCNHTICTLLPLVHYYVDVLLIMSMWLIHVVWEVVHSSSLLFSTWIYHNLLIHSPDNGHLSCFSLGLL